ncbi:50S ribosomal protein L27 [Paramicrosporidium saccamoebae]|uniref:Large ribosomal subunit protein bL27m n=1 Tax=Paramicrosporidium saccamoebae TaxID=1246581 RepID=A0A2H9TNK4_9FUNG|nr:50S ribosomal protein L27 [Paramicrosporidium saccamoebae]
MIFRFGASGLSVPNLPSVASPLGFFKRWATNLGGGNTQNGRDSAGRRLGVKLGNGATAHKNQIIIRQRGFQYWPGSNDHTLHAKVNGIVKFSKDYDTKRTYISPLPQVSVAAVDAASKPNGGGLPPPPEIDTLVETAKLTLANGIASGIAIAMGILMCFSGKRFFKLFLGSVGFLAGGLLGLMGAEFVKPHVAAENLTMITWIAIVLLGVVVAALSMWMWKVGVYIGAGLGGYSLMTYILSLRAGGIIQNAIGRSAALVVGAGLAVVAAVFLEDIAIIAASAITGALLVVLGADFYLKIGFKEHLYNIAVGDRFALNKTYDPLMYWLLSGTAALAVLGAVVQLLVPSKGYGRGE